MALELRNRLERALGLTLSASLIWQHPSIAALTEALLRCEGFGPGASTQDRAVREPLPAPQSEFEFEEGQF
jgi:hypothetical protein